MIRGRGWPLAELITCGTWICFWGCGCAPTIWMPPEALGLTTTWPPPGVCCLTVGHCLI